MPKQYLPIAGKPLLFHTLDRLSMHPRVAGLMVVLAADDRWWPGLTQLHDKPVRTAAGGGERADSVLSGLLALRNLIADEHFILVHDAARPCIEAGDISRLFDMGMPAGGALLAVPLRDTLKRADAAQRVAATEPREARWRALTPQLFRYGELVAALKSAREAGVVVSDEAMAMELLGHAPSLIEGAESNIKVTTPPDFALAEFILARQACA